MVNDIVHKNILENEKRPDGRKLDELRELSGEVALFSRTHGSAIFVRGNTQALAHHDARGAGRRAAYRNDGNECQAALYAAL